MNKREVRSEVCQKKANGLEKGNTRQAITEKGGGQAFKERKKDDKEQNNKMGGGKVGTARPDKQNFPKKLQNCGKGSKKLRPKDRKTFKKAQVLLQKMISGEGRKAGAKKRNGTL